MSSPTQQPPPAGWEQGTWTQHGGPTSTEGNGRLLPIGIGVLAVVIVAAAVVLLVV